MESNERKTESENVERLGNDSMEYVIFTVTASNGTEVEMAVVDEFDYEHKHYVVAARVIDDEISEEGQYIYLAKITENDFIPEKITNMNEYEKIAKAYMEMED